MKTQTQKTRHIGTGTFYATPRINELMREVLDSGRIGYGEKSKMLERDFARVHQSKYGVLSNSGTSSLQVAVQTLKELHRWNRGDEIIVPATTFVASPNVIKHNDLIPVFVDVDPYTYNMDPELVLEKISDRTRAIMPVHLFGQPCNMTAIMEIAEAYDLKVIEDSCETMFVAHKGKMVGSFGDIACFSMYVAHLLVGGVGGIAITNNFDLAAKMRSLVNHGLRLEDLNLDDYASPQPMIGRKFLFDSVGHSFRITEFEAAGALGQLESYKDMLKRRQKNGKHYTASLKLINDNYSQRPYQRVVIEEDNEHAFMMYPIVLRYTDEQFNKTNLTKFLNERDIETRDMLPILNQPAYSYVPSQDFPVSKNLIENGFYIGCHQDLQTEDIQYVLNTLSEFANTYLRGK